MRIHSRLSNRTAVLAWALAAVLSCSFQAKAGPPGAGTVVYIGGNDLVLKTADGTLLNYSVSDRDRFSVNGKPMTLADLKPGTTLSAPVASAIKPKPVAAVSVVKGKVYAVTPPDGITLSLTEGIKELSVPAGTMFQVGGQSLTVTQLKQDMMIEATVVTTAPDGAPADHAATAVSTPAMVGPLLISNPEPSQGDLPLAGTNLPLYALLGVALLVIGFFLQLGRRRGHAANV